MADSVRGGADALPAQPDFWRLTPEGIAVAVRVQPKSRRPGLRGLAQAADGTRLRIGVSEAPEDGRANRAACAALARALDLPASRMSVVSGASRREKTILVADPQPEEIRRLAGLLPSGVLVPGRPGVP